MCSSTGATRTPGGDQPGDQAVGERPAGARHLGAARVLGEHGLVVARAARPGARSRTGSAGRGASGSPDTDAAPAVSTSARHSRPARVRLAAASPRRRRAAGSVGPRRRRVRRGGLAGLPAQLDQPATRRPPRWRSARSAGCRRPAPPPAGCAEVLTTSTSPGAQQRRQVGEPVVVHRADGPLADQQPDAVAGEPARLRRLVRLQRGGQREVRASAVTAAAPASSSARRMRPDGGASASSRRKAGTTVRAAAGR